MVFVLAATGVSAAHSSMVRQESAPVPALEGQTPPRVSQTQEFKRSILDPEAEYASRRTVANLLIRVGTPEAFQAAAEVLDPGANPAAQKAVCDALVQTAAEMPEILSTEGAGQIADRLCILIGAEDAEVRLKAVAAFSAFPRRLWVGRLTTIASDPSLPEIRRLAAIDALSRHVHLRPVVELFIRLLDDPSVSVVQRTLAALAPVSRRPIGARVEDWKAWWQTQSRQSEQEWLEGRVELLSGRERALESQRNEVQTAFERQASALNTKIADLQSDLLLALPEKDRDARLVAWLADPMPAICGGAMQLVLRRISDASGAPTEVVRAAVVKNVEHPSADVRRRAFQVIGAIKDPSDAALVHDRLGRETDAQTRQAALAVLGQIKNAASIPVLLTEISNATAQPDGVAAAAHALAGIAAGNTDLKAADWEPATVVLKERLARLGENSNGLRGAVVEAMAALGHPALEGDLLAELERTDPVVLRPAIRGLVRLRNVSKLPRIRALTAWADAPLRQAACEALGLMGSEDADIETLLQRVKPGVESQAPVRDAAWIALKALLSRRPLDQQWAWLDRLADAPSLQVEYITQMMSEESASRLDAGMVLIARERLASALMTLARWNDAVDPLEKVFDQLALQGDARTSDTGIRWMDVLLKAEDLAGLSAAVPRVAALGPEAQARIVAYLEGILAGEEYRSKPERRAALVRQLEGISPQGLGEGWARLMEGLKESPLPPPGSTPAPEAGDVPP